MSKFQILFPFLLFFIHFPTNYAANSSCPIDFTYVETFPWDSSLCHEPAQSSCCQTLHSVFGMGLAQYLKQTSMFYLPDLNTSSSCIANFEDKLASISISSSLFASCFNDTGEFVNMPSTSCAGIITTQDWTSKKLVYDFMSNGSLDEHLFSSANKPLSWPQRKNIILDVAKGLAYLHYGIKPAIYHRDIKATNILLDSDMKARVADFGLAKQSTEGQSHLTTRVAGTYGYLAPEYALYGQLTEKSDVYSFGILILEIMSGRRVLDASDPSKILITDWAWALLKSGKVEDIFHASIRNDGPKGVMERFVLVGILSSHVMVALRPTIADALKMLEGDIDIPRLPERPLPLSHQSFQTSLNNSMSTSEGSRAMPSFSSSR